MSSPPHRPLPYVRLGNRGEQPMQVFAHLQECMYGGHDQRVVSLNWSTQPDLWR
jgi:hypothetical protein